MAEFALKNSGGRRIASFHAAADPEDAEACDKLLKKRAKDHGLKPDEVELIAYRTGKPPISYRAT